MNTRSDWVSWAKLSLAWQRRICWLVVMLLVCSGGCTRRFYRNRADKEVAHILAEKDRYPFWKIENYHVYPDPRARFADPTNPDRPPMPPDDPAAWALAPKPQKPRKAGVKRVEGDGYLALLTKWDVQNRAAQESRGSGIGDRDSGIGDRELGTGDRNQGPGSFVQPSSFRTPKPQPRSPNPDPQSPIPEGVLRTAILQPPKTEDEEGATLPPPKVLPKEDSPQKDYSSAADEPQDRSFLLKMDQAVELAVINSREFQTQRENLYLAALPVSQARFSFAAQFFALETAIREATGSETGSGRGNRWRVNSTNGFTKLFPTGALLLAAFANKTVINLTGTDLHTLSQSTINLDIIQPLLRGAGLAVTLEPLTQAERNLLYQIRFYARFRKEFYQAIVSGGDFSGALSIPFGVGGGVAIGSQSLGTGNPARPEVTPGSAGSIILGGGQLALTEGYLPTLLRRAQLNIERNNASALEDFLRLFEGFAEPGGEGITSLQVDQVRLQLLDARTKVLQKQQEMRDSLDRFKLQLGVPVPLGLDLMDEPIQPITQQMKRFDIILEQYKKVTKEIGESDNIAEAPLLRGRVRRLLLESDLVRDTIDFRRNMVKRLAEWEQADSKQLEERLAQMRRQVRDLLDKKTTFERKGEPWPSSEQKALAELEASQQVGELVKALRRYQAEPWKKETSEKERRRKHNEYFTYVRIPFSLVLSEASKERFDLVRPLWPTTPPVEVDGQNLLQLNWEAAYDVTARTALSNRLDLMNARAQLQDSWRQIAIFANSLLGTFLIGYHIDTATPPNEAQPFAFAGSRTRNQLVLNLDLPLVRLPERNNYRASLIAYQRQRRALMAAEDFVINQVRADLRLLRFLAENFKIQQEAVALAYLQVESSLETFQAPPEPGGRSTAAAAAALTQQLLNAQRSLLQAQNQLLITWISYQIARRQLYLNLEFLPLDPRGVWLDDLSSHQNTAATPRPGSGGTSPSPAPGPGQPGPLPAPARLLPPRDLPPDFAATR